MSTKEAYVQKIETELDFVANQLAEFKAEPISLTAADRVKHLNRIEELEHRIAASRAKLQELDKAQGHVLHEIKESIENTWIALQKQVQEAISKK